MFHTILTNIFTKKKQSWYHILSASLIIVYWWGLWNILDVIFLGGQYSVHQIIVLVCIVILSVLALILLDFDLSDFY